MPQDEGMKSRLSEVTMITKRSSHMPTFTKSDMMNRSAVLVRTLLNHSAWIITTLIEMSVQYDQPYGPNMRFHIMKRSCGLALYHAKNASIAYPYPTMRPVASMTLAMLSMCRIVIR